MPAPPRMNMLERDATLLWRTPLFSEIDPAQLKMLVFAAERRRLRPGQLLVRKEEVSHAAFVIIAGSVQVEVTGGSAIRHLKLGPGAIIGELALLTGKPSPVSIMAAEPLEVLKLTRELVERFISEFPEIGERMLHAWQRRVERSFADMRQMEALLRNREPAASGGVTDNKSQNILHRNTKPA